MLVQKSIAEGFGLAVAEAMRKARPVLASRIGGIQDQIEDDRSGKLVDAQDLAVYGQTVVDLIANPDWPKRATTSGSSHAASIQL